MQSQKEEVTEEKVHDSEPTGGDGFLWGIWIEGSQLSYSTTSQNTEGLWLAWDTKAKEQLSSEEVSF